MDGLSWLLIGFSCACEVKEKGEKNGAGHMLLQGENILCFVKGRGGTGANLHYILTDHIKCLPVTRTLNYKIWC